MTVNDDDAAEATYVARTNPAYRPTEDSDTSL
jgi:hypothetical protein